MGILVLRVLLIRLLQGTVRQVVYFGFLVIDPPRGRPFGGGGVIINLIHRYHSPIISESHDFHGSGSNISFIQVSHKNYSIL